MVFSLTFEPTAMALKTFQFMKRGANAPKAIAASAANENNNVVVTSHDLRRRRRSTKFTESQQIFSMGTITRFKLIFGRKKEPEPEPEDYTLPELTFDHRLLMVIELDQDVPENVTLPVEYLVKCGDGRFVRVMGTNKKTVAQNIAEMALDELQRQGIAVDLVLVDYLNGDIFNGGANKVGNVTALETPKAKPTKGDDVETPVTTPVEDQIRHRRDVGSSLYTDEDSLQASA